MAAEPVKAAWTLLVNPSRIIACFAFIFVVRSADVNAKRADIAVPGVEPGGMNELLDNLIAASVAAGSQTEPELPDVLSHITDSTSPSVSSNQHVTPEVVGMMEEKERSWPDDNFITLPVLVPTSPKVQEACRKHSRIFIHQLKRYKLWALQMFDSSAKIPSGILRGNVNQYGDFDQCLAVSVGEIKGQYCLVSLDLQATSSTSNNVEPLYEPLEMALSHRFIRSTFRDPGHFIPRFTTINWAVCVPSSCSAIDIHQAFEDAIIPYNVTYGINITVQVDPEMCYLKEEESKGYSKAALWTLSFFAVTALSAIVATLRDSMHVTSNHIPGRAEKLLLAFSLKRNMKMLLADLPTEGDINCIYGVRAICTVALYLAHKVIALALMPYSNRITLTEVANAAWSTIFRASLIYTDSFLLLSGTLTSFNLSREMERKGYIQWASRLLARFIRLTPALVAVLLFYAYVMEHLGIGPLWNLSVKRNADICKEMFWRNVLYIQNLFPFEEMCATHTHQLALDMQLSLLSPLLVWLLWQWRLCAITTMLAIAAISAVVRYLATLQHDLSLVIFHGITVSQLYKTANLTYAHSLHRATPYLVGVALGYMLYKTGKHFHIPKVAVWGGWLLATGLAAISLVSPAHLAFRDYHYDVQEASLYAVISPLTWSLALAWLIWACFTGNGGPVNTFLCLRSLVLFSRISYAVYLTQFAVFFYNVGSMRTSVPFSLFTCVDMVELVTIILVSIVVTLLFDLPMQEVKGILMGGGSRQKREKVE